MKIYKIIIYKYNNNMMGSVCNKDDYANYTYSNCPKLFNDVKIIGRVVDIYDGDTMTVILKMLDNYYRFTVRLNGIDTCEMRTRNTILKNKALQARNQVYNLVTSNILSDEKIDRKHMRIILNENVYMVNLHIYDTDKYGRLLADVYPINSKKSLSEILLEKNMAYVYKGGTKETEEEQLND
jgi:endonuclease YncB( thermonuclease family)